MKNYQETYRDFLKNILSKRVQVNPSYSLRAFARDVGMSPSSMSEVLSGKKNLSQEMAFKICLSLNLKKNESELFCNLVGFETSKNSKAKKYFQDKLTIKKMSQQKQNMEIDVFQYISDWYHIPILEMTNLVDFKMNARSISDKLGISTIQAHQALERLLRLGLLVKNPNEQYKKSQNNMNFVAINKNVALREFYQQMLKKSIETIVSGDAEQRVIGSETFVLDQENLKEAEEIIENCFSQLVALSAKSNKKNQVYHLGIQLLPLLKRKLK